MFFGQRLKKIQIHQSTLTRNFMFTTQTLKNIFSIAALSITLYGCNTYNPIENMRCEYQTSPKGVDTPHPRFTWEYRTQENSYENFRQVGYQLYISERKEDLKELAKITPAIDFTKTEASYAVYSGNPILKPETRYYWRVSVSADGRKFCIDSRIASFETGKGNTTNWTAAWITDAFDKNEAPAPMLRKRFTAKNNIEQARLYISAAGYYLFNINGTPVTTSHLNPGFTHYDKRNLYNTYDVTPQIKSGDNVLTAVLGNGFYNEAAPVATWDYEKARWRNRPRMICELHIRYKDGSRQVINSDETWKTTLGAYRQDNIYSGDTYDAQMEVSGWEDARMDDAVYPNAVRVAAPSPLLTSQMMPAIKVERKIAPIAMRNFGDTVYVYDFGINMSGVAQLTVKAEKGTKIELQHGELMKSNGRIEMRNIDFYYKPLPGLAFQTDTYISNGLQQTFTPAFTYHGFRYVEVRADRPVRLTEKSLTALYFHTAVAPAGKFECSNPLLNKIWKAANQSYLSNLMSIPTDCPQREKNGWTADAHVTIDLALLNFDGINFYEKWLDDIIDNQNAEGRISGIIPSSGWGYDDWIGPVWDAAMFIVPMSLYHYYGDTRSIEKLWPVCQKYLDYLASREDKDGTVTYGIGDWVYYKTQTPTDYTTTCYYYLDHLYMARFANLLGKNGTKYAKKAEELKLLIQKKYFDSTKYTYANGSQTAQAVALYIGVVPKAYEQKVADRLAQTIEENNGKLDFGVLGSKTVLRMLSHYGYADLAYRMATQEEAPSWGHWIKQGFTTLAETWVLSPEFRDASVNHVFLGDINAWMYQVLAGINYDEQQPGFKHIIIHPHFVKGLDWVSAEYRSVKGLIKSTWKRKNNQVILNVQIPLNTTATVICGNKRLKLKAGIHQRTFTDDE